MSQKKLPSSLESLRSLVEPEHQNLSLRRQCELLGSARSSYFLEPARKSPDNLYLMRLIDAHHLEHPYVVRKGMTQWLDLQGYEVNIKRVRRLMNLMDLAASYPRPRTTIRDQSHAVFPYLLRGVTISRNNQFWSSDMTCIPIERGYMYLTAVIKWYIVP